MHCFVFLGIWEVSQRSHPLESKTECKTIGDTDLCYGSGDFYRMFVVWVLGSRKMLLWLKQKCAMRWGIYENIQVNLTSEGEWVNRSLGKSLNGKPINLSIGDRQTSLKTHRGAALTTLILVCCRWVCFVFRLCRSILRMCEATTAAKLKQNTFGFPRQNWQLTTGAPSFVRCTAHREGTV